MRLPPFNLHRKWKVLGAHHPHGHIPMRRHSELQWKLQETRASAGKHRKRPKRGGKWWYVGRTKWPVMASRQPRKSRDECQFWSSVGMNGGLLESNVNVEVLDAAVPCAHQYRGSDVTSPPLMFHILETWSPVGATDVRSTSLSFPPFLFFFVGTVVISEYSPPPLFLLSFRTPARSFNSLVVEP